MVQPIRYRDGYKHQLAEPYEIELPELRPWVTRELEIAPWLWLRLVDDVPVLMIRQGYAWDGASGPTWDTQSFHRGPCVHDALYQLIRAELLSPEARGAADEIMLRLILEDVEHRWEGALYGPVRATLRARARIWYRSVRVGASFAADPDAKRPVLVAP